MCKILRSIARHNMEKAGITQINKPIEVKIGGVYRKTSKFALYWRKYLTATTK